MTIKDLPTFNKIRENVTRRCIRNNKRGKCAGCGVLFKHEGRGYKLFDLKWCINCYHRRELGYRLREEP